MLGMNDGEYQSFDEKIFTRFAVGYRYLVRKLKRTLPKVRLTLLEPSPYDDVTRPAEFPLGYNSVLVRFSEFVRGLAESESAADADLNSPVVALLRAANHTAGRTAQHLIPDRVHPSAGVHIVMAEAVLKAWHAPAVVTSVEIDATTGTVAKAANATVREVARDNGISWIQTDQALPMPLDTPDEMIDLALRCSDVNDALNQETLKVRGLAGGKYHLKIDEQEIGVFDTRQLESGVNLATMPTPMSRQAQLVLDLTHRHNNLHFARWRMVEDALKDYELTKTPTTLRDLDALEDEVIALQKTTSAPRPHRYRIEP